MTYTRIHLVIGSGNFVAALSEARQVLTGIPVSQRWILPGRPLAQGSVVGTSTARKPKILDGTLAE